MEVKDSLGVVINVGDTIAYPVRQGSAIWTSTIKVSDILSEPTGPAIVGTNSTGRRVTVRKVKNVIVAKGSI